MSTHKDRFRNREVEEYWRKRLPIPKREIPDNYVYHKKEWYLSQEEKDSLYFMLDFGIFLMFNVVELKYYIKKRLLSGWEKYGPFPDQEAAISFYILVVKHD